VFNRESKLTSGKSDSGTIYPAEVELGDLNHSKSSYEVDPIPDTVNRHI
jgi:hypothetical protein